MLVWFTLIRMREATMRNYPIRQKASASLAALLAAGLAAGCTAQPGTGPAAPAAPAESAAKKEAPPAGANPAAAEKTVITMLLKYYSPEPPVKAAEAIRTIEEYTNTKLDIVWAPNPSYDEKVNTTLASGNLPQVMLVAEDRADNIVSAVKAQAFWEVGPYLKDYPNLTRAIDDIRRYNASHEGKLYSVPSTRGLSESALIYRKDWLDNVGLKPPQTIDELYEMMKAFTQNDPDKNGKNDTFGLIEWGADGSSLFTQLKYWFGAPNQWADRDGKLVPEFMTAEYKAAMDFMRKLYQEKLINPDFAVTNQNQMLDYINKGKAGGYPGAFAQFSNGWLNPLTQANPQAKLDFLYKIRSPDGKFRKSAAGGYNGAFMFPKSSVKTEAQLKRILAFFDQIAGDNMRTLIKLGIEGKHYQLENGKPKIINPQQFSDEIIPLRWIMVADGISDRIAVGLTELDQRITAASEDKDMVYVPDPAYPFTTKLIVDDKIIGDARTKYIMGELDESGWNAAIEKWRASRGDQMTAEFQKQYEVARQAGQ